jgi:hypothetical protein
VANWHARQGDDFGNAFSIIYHIPIPNVNNAAGVSYRTALVQAGLNTTVMAEGSGAGLVSTAEKNSIAAGAIYEHVETVYSRPAETAAQLKARIDQRFTDLTAEIQAKFAKQFTYWGYEAT